MYALNAITRMEEDLERMKALLDERNRAQQEVAGLHCLIEELANEFMIVGDDPANPLPAYMDKDDLYHYLVNERLADKVNKALGLVK